MCTGSQTAIQANFRRECIQKAEFLLHGIWNVKKAFDRLKELCTTKPILAYADFEKPFKLHTDASVLGLGAVLYQVQDGI